MQIPEWMIMGNHGGYVWSAYGITFLVLMVVTYMSLRARKRQWEKLKQMKQNEQSDSTRKLDGEN